MITSHSDLPARQNYDYFSRTRPRMRPKTAGQRPSERHGGRLIRSPAAALGHGRGLGCDPM